jgi:hypothetical protein
MKESSVASFMDHSPWLISRNVMMVEASEALPWRFNKFLSGLHLMRHPRQAPTIATVNGMHRRYQLRCGSQCPIMKNGAPPFCFSHG